jgi:general stress protein 26
MQKLTQEIISLFKECGFAILSSIDKKMRPHTSCKGIVKIDQQAGRIYLLDLYYGKTVANIKSCPNISLTVVNEDSFSGYCLQAAAKIVPKKNIDAKMLQAWEEVVSSRVSRRLIKNIRDGKTRLAHPEIMLPKPAYLIEARIERIINLRPRHLK